MGVMLLTDLLAVLMGMSVLSLPGHFAVPRVHPIALRLRGAGNGLFIVTLADRIAAHRPNQDSRKLKLTLYDDQDQYLRSDQKEEEEDSSSSFIMIMIIYRVIFGKNWHGKPAYWQLLAAADSILSRAPRQEGFAPPYRSKSQFQHIQAAS